MSSRLLSSVLRYNRLFSYRLITLNIFEKCAQSQRTVDLKFPSQTTSTSFWNFSTRAALNAKPRNTDDFLNKIKSDFSTLGYVRYANLQKFVQSLEKSRQPLFEDQNVHFLLDTCAQYLPSQSSESRMDIFNKIWEHLKSEKLLQKAHYLGALRVLRKNRVPLTDFRKFLTDSQLENDSETYEHLIYLCCENGDVKSATEILGEMRQKNFSLTENVFNALILGHSRNNNLPQCLEVLEAMYATGMTPSNETNSELLRAYIENAEFDKVKKMLQEHSNSFSSAQILKCLRSSALAKHKEIVDVLLRQLPSDMLFVKEIPAVISNICTELIYAKKVEEAYLIVDAYPKPQFNENQDIDTFGVFFIRDLLLSGVMPDKTIEICNSLIRSEKNSRALHIACEFALRRNIPNALVYLKALSNLETLRPHYFWPLISNEFLTEGEVGIIYMLKEMCTLNVECDYDTLSQHVLPKLSLTLDNEKEAIQTLERCGLKSSQILTPLIVNLIFQHKMDSVISLAQLYQSKLDTKRFVHPLAALGISIKSTRQYQKFARVIQTLAMKSDNPKVDLAGQVFLEMIAHPRLKNETEFLCKVLEEFKLTGGKLAPSSAEILSSHLGKIDNTRVAGTHTILHSMVNKKLSLPTTAENCSASHIVHPRDMSLDELECHLIELESKNLNSRGVLRRLLQLCVRDGKLERALEVKQKCDRLKVQTSPGMMASIFDMYIRTKKLNEAQETLSRIKKQYPGFLLDEHKIIDFASLLVEHNKLDEAKNMLSERATSTKVTGGEYVLKNLWKLLTNVAVLSAQTHSKTDHVNESKEFHEFLKTHRYCDSQNTILGPIIREWILRRQVEYAVKELKHLAEKYKKTPLQFEMISLLVSLSNGNDLDVFGISQTDAKNLLQEVTTTVSGVHGPVNMNSSLLLAVAESGTESQLRKLLINPGFRINQGALVKNCEHLSVSGKVQTLLRLAKASRGLHHTIKEQDIYLLLLEQFTKENNCEAALQLFDKLEADDELKVSQDFIRNLVRLLQVNKLEIPSNVALRAQII